MEYGPGWPANPTPGDPYGLGGPVNSLRSALLADLGGHASVQTVSVSYDSSNVATLLTNVPKYFANLQAGVDWTGTFLTQQAAACPDQKIVLAGYSQGAMIMHRILHQLGTKMLGRVSSAVLIADGDQVPADDVTRFGTAADTAIGIAQANCAIPLYSHAKFGNVAGSRVLSVCNSGDIVCDAKPADFNAAGIAVHLNYTSTVPVQQAAQLAAVRLADAQNCSDVLFLGARGSGEYGPGSPGWPAKQTARDPHGLGGPVSSLYSSLLAGLAGRETIQTLSLAYDSSSVTTLLTSASAYFGNLQAGVDWADTILTLQAAACPDQVIVLAGYSQGAMIMHRLTHNFGTKLLHRVGAVVLIADGDEVPRDDVTRLGTAPATAKGIAQIDCAITLCSRAKFSGLAGSRVVSVCKTGDIVCDATPSDFNANGIKVHLDYAATRPVREAAQLADDRTAALAPFDGGLSSIDAVSASDAWAAGNYCTICTARELDQFSLLLRWNGTAWKQYAGPASVYDVRQVSAISSTSAWAVGETFGAAAANVGAILRWNGTAWALAATYTLSPTDTELQAVAARTTHDAWAVGDYCAAKCSVGNPPAYHTLILHWNGTSWSRTRSPNPSTSFITLDGVTATAANDAWAVGSYCASDCGPTGNQVFKTLVLHWNGSTWTQEKSPNPTACFPQSFLTAVAAGSASDAWAVGSTPDNSSGCGLGPLTAHWDGTSWSQVAAPSPPNSGLSELNGVTVAGSRAWAAGYEFPSTGDGLEQPLILAWNGSTWSQQTVPASPYDEMLSAVSSDTTGQAWAIGDYCAFDCGNFTAIFHPVVLRWTGTAWVRARI
jgi:hypothetical protein